MGAIAGVAAGALLGGLTSKKQQTSTQVAKADPWGPVQPYLQGLYRDAWNAATPQYYPHSTVAPFGEATQAAQARIYNKGLQGIDPALAAANREAQSTIRGDYLFRNPAMGELNRIGGGRYLMSNPAMRYLDATAGGNFLNSNPYLDSMFEQAADRVGSTFQKYTTPGIDSSFALGGRYGSNSHQQAVDTAQENFGDTLKNLATDIYGGNYARERGLMETAAGTMGSLYGQERGLQNQALGALGDIFGRERLLQTQTLGITPELQQAGYLPFQQMLAIGAAQDAKNQQQIDDNVARWDFNQNAERERLGFINDILSGASKYGTQTTSGSQGGNPLMGILGGGLMGAQIGSMFPLAGAGAAASPVNMASFANPGDIYGLFY